MITSYIRKNGPLLVSALLMLAVSSFTLFKPIEQISMQMTVKSLAKKKSLTATGEVYYRVAGGLMVTHFAQPLDYLVMTDSKGMMKIYNKADNSVMQNQSGEFSSDNSFIYCFLSGKSQDMGLRSMGFELKDTKVEDQMVVTTWKPAAPLSSGITKAELVHENYQPIYMSLFDSKGKVAQKVFYADFKKVGDYNIPMTITEFEYIKTDSVITKRMYSDPKINEQVSTAYLDFKIPANAKILKGQ